MKIKRIPYGSEKSFHWTKKELQTHSTCHDCGSKVGQLHKSKSNWCCDMEECPICHKQLMGDIHEEIILKGTGKEKLGIKAIGWLKF